MAKTGYVYILTNKNRTVLYIGVTNSIKRRLWEHNNESKGFTKKYNVHYLVYYESISGFMNAINREKQLKKWNRKKKNALIESTNPDWIFMNDEFLKEDS